MANLNDYGIYFIYHGEWSDPEIKWEKSDFQTLLFNYWDVAECTDYESLDLTDDIDLQTLVAQLWELHPQSYGRPRIDYEWEVSSDELYDFYDDSDYYKDYKLSDKEDFVLHTASQALRQALKFLDDENCANADIQVFKNVSGRRTLVANYSLQGSTLKDCMFYGKN
jgi:hypothetical protein